jgi:transcriptional regulator with XRE-family HTH domain
MSLTELADKSNVSVGSLSQIENGRGNPSLAMLQRIASALSVDASQLLSAPPVGATAIVRASERPRLRTMHTDEEVELLTPDIQHDLTVSRSVMAPGEKAPDTGYTGELCILIHRGHMRIQWETGETTDLHPGDAVSYTIPRHSIRSNVGRGPLEYTGLFCPRVT